MGIQSFLLDIARSEFILTIVGTVGGGILLTFILFLLNEFVFTRRNITGVWIIKTEILESSFNPYLHLRNEYHLNLLQKGNELIGTGEKLKDISNKREIRFAHSKRPTISIEGYYDRKYLGKSKLYLQVLEQGSSRETRAMYILKFEKVDRLEGTFSSTAADSRGIVEIERSPKPIV